MSLTSLNFEAPQEILATREQIAKYDTYGEHSPEDVAPYALEQELKKTDENNKQIYHRMEKEWVDTFEQRLISLGLEIPLGGMRISRGDNHNWKSASTEQENVYLESVIQNPSSELNHSFGKVLRIGVDISEYGREPYEKITAYSSSGVVRSSLELALGDDGEVSSLIVSLRVRHPEGTPTDTLPEYCMLKYLSDGTLRSIITYKFVPADGRNISPQTEIEEIFYSEEFDEEVERIEILQRDLGVYFNLPEVVIPKKINVKGTFSASAQGFLRSDTKLPVFDEFLNEPTKAEELEHA